MFIDTFRGTLLNAEDTKILNVGTNILAARVDNRFQGIKIVENAIYLVPV